MPANVLRMSARVGVLGAGGALVVEHIDRVDELAELDPQVAHLILHPRLPEGDRPAVAVGVPQEVVGEVLPGVAFETKAGAPDGQTKFPAALDIDYIRVFARR